MTETQSGGEAIAGGEAITRLREDSTGSKLPPIFPVSPRPLPPGLAAAGFDGDIVFSPAFDRRAEGAGIGSLELIFWLRGPGGAVTWDLLTGCYLPSTDAEWLSRFRWQTHKPTPGAITWHSPEPLWEGHQSQDDCRLLGPGRACYSDAGYLIGDRAYEALVTGGEGALWLCLMAFCGQKFGDKSGLSSGARKTEGAKTEGVEG